MPTNPDGSAWKVTLRFRPWLVQILLVLWTYFAAVLTDPGRVPPDWHPFLDEQVHPGLLNK